MANENNKQSVSGNDLLKRVAEWTIGGAALNLKSSNLAKCAILGPLSEIAFNYRIEDVLAEAIREQQELKRQQEEQQRQERIRQNIMRWLGPGNQLSVNTTEQTQLIAVPAPSATKMQLVDPDSKWLKVVSHPSVVVILGQRGRGKSALGYRLLELFRYTATPYVLGLPSKAAGLLPEWMGVAEELEHIPNDSVVFIDEAYLGYHARESHTTKSTEASQIVNLSRQKEQTLIFVTQESRQIDINIASQANVIVFKEPNILQSKFDRPELREITAKATEAFRTITDAKYKWSYVYSPGTDFIGLIENSLPTFWSSKLSRAFANPQAIATTRTAKKMTRGEKIVRAKELHESGISYRLIGTALNVNEATAYNYINGYPYEKKG